MAKNKDLKLSIQIAGKIDKSLASALGKAEKGVSGFSKTISKIGTAGLAAMGALGTASVAAIVDCTKSAKEFEAQMGDVVKYVDGLADSMGKISDKLDPETGRTYAENYSMMKDAILDLSTQIPMTAEELTELAAAAGQSGKGINDLIQYDSNGNIQGFLKDVAMMGTAMDIDAKQAGDWAAKWEHAFNMNHSQIMVLADQINYLGANSATTAAEIAKAVNDAGSLGQIAGADVSTTAALADAMLATGVSSDRVGTSLKRIYTNISKGASATKTQKDAWSELGMSAEQIAKDMQIDASGTMLKVFDAIGNLPDERQVATLSNLFGQWAIEGAAKITGNIESYTEALRMVNDPSLYKGSMEREFIIKADTAESIDKMLANSWEALKIDLGDEFLPVKKQLATAMIDLMGTVRKNMPQLKSLGETLADLASKGIDKLSGALETALPYVQTALDYVSKNGDKVVKVIGEMAATFAGMKAAPLIETLLGGGASLLFGSKGISGKKSGGLFSGIAGLFTGGQKAGNNLADMIIGGWKAGTSTNATMGAKGGIMGILAKFQNRKGLYGGDVKLAGKAATNVIDTLIGASGPGQIIADMFKSTKAGKAAGGIGSYLGRVGSAFGNVKNNSIVSAITGDLGKIGGFVKMGFGGLGEGFGTLFKMAGSGIANSRAGQFVGGTIGKAGGLLGKVGGGIKAGAGAIGGALSGPLSALGSLGGSLLNFGTTALGPLAGMFGSVLSGALPIIGVISAIVAVLSILYDHLDDVRGVVEQVFGEQGVAVFDSFKDGLDGVLGFIKGIFNGGLADALAPVKEIVVQFFSDMFGENVVDTVSTTFDSVTSILQSVLTVVGQIVNFGVTYVKPIIEEIFKYLVNTVFPIILQTFNTMAPTISSLITNIGNAVMTVVETVAPLIQGLLPIIESIITVLLTAASVVVPALLAAFNTVWETISAVVVDIQTIFNGLIEFFGGVFTGDWETAWQGIKDIFGGAFEALGELCKAPLNVVITLINKAIEGINGLGLKIPDWVPVIGGKDFTIDIPTIPMLAKGGFTNGPSLAGEAGREAVISFDRSVRAKNLSTWARAGELLGVKPIELKEISTGGSWTDQSNITFAPQITIQGNADDSTVDRLMAQMRTMFEDWYEQRQKQQFRTAY